MTVPTKDKTLAPAAVDNGGKHIQQQRQSRVRLEPELTPQKVQRLAVPGTGRLPREAEVHCDSQQRKEHWLLRSGKNMTLLLIHSAVDSRSSSLSFSSAVVLFIIIISI